MTQKLSRWSVKPHKAVVAPVHRPRRLVRLARKVG